MGRVFWIACGVGFVAAIGIWGGLTYPVLGEVGARRKDVKDHQKDLRDRAGKPGEIKNKFFIDAVKRFKGELVDEEKVLLDLMKERSFKEPEWPEGVSKDMAAFRIHMMQKYKERNNVLQACNVAFPRPKKLGDVEEWARVEKSDAPRILRRFFVTREVFDAIKDARPGARYEDERKGTVVKETAVTELREISFDEDTERTGEGKVLVHEYTFDVEFIAHYNAAVDVIRRIESSKRGLFLTRLAHVTRTGSSYDATSEPAVRLKVKFGLIRFPKAEVGEKK